MLKFFFYLFVFLSLSLLSRISVVAQQSRLPITATTPNWVDILESASQGDIITFEAGFFKKI